MDMYEIRLECLKEALKTRGDVFHGVEKIIEDARKMFDFVSQAKTCAPSPSDSPRKD